MSFKTRADKFEDLYFSSEERETLSNSETEIEDNFNMLLQNFYSEWKSCNIKVDSKTGTVEDKTPQITAVAESAKEIKNEIKVPVPKSIHKDHRKRVRDKFLKYGLETFTEFEVLELLLYYAIAQKDTNEIAHKLIDEFGTLKAVMNAEYYDLMEVGGISEVSASLIVLHREIAKYVRTKEYERINLSTSYISGKFCCKYFKSHVEESFIMIYLDSYDSIEHIDVISHGVENETAFYPRRILKLILRRRSNKIMLAHNHPGDNAEPSGNDILATAKLVLALEDMGITLKDHIICAGENYVSMSDRGHLNVKKEGFNPYLEG